MTKFNKSMKDDEFLFMLETLDDYDLITAMHEIVPDVKIEDTDILVDSLRDDIPTLLDYQSNLDENITDYKFIETGIYYDQIAIADTVFDLFDDLDWLWYKDRLIEWFNNDNNLKELLNR